MFIMSAIYLIGAIVLIIFNKIEFDILNFFNTDGLALLGCIFALGEMIFSKRNFISKKINELFISKKQVNSAINIHLKCLTDKVDLVNISNKFEEILKENLTLGNLGIRRISKFLDNRIRLRYENIGLELEYYKEGRECNIRLKGQLQYGNINSKKNNILYLSNLVKILSTDFLNDNIIRKFIEVKNIELIIYRDGSEFKLNNIFNEDLIKVIRYNFKTVDNMKGKSEIEISNTQITLKSLKENEFLESFKELTNIICNIN